MRVQFRQIFARDLEHIRDKRLLERIRGVVELVERAESLEEVPHLKKLQGGSYFRIRVGDYRLGLVVQGGEVTFVRALHRKEVYRYFP
ncbi:MAG TPA: type II toxin-antitoxin system RelE/ParE family toxin [Thermoanaerobaculia bacterium]|nr:type II toxin-antitoxin system RelE/ParE family toxin [Thermoanaerobaculia bacterium]